MDKDVIISIKGNQSFEDADPECIELTTLGHLADWGDGGFTLSYQESQLTGLEGTLTTFQVEQNRIILMRIGKVNSQMVFEVGKPHLSLYNTPYGPLSIGISTRRMRSTLGVSGGDISIDYAINIDDTAAGENLFEISVREAASPITKLKQ
ncbi:MAG: DUF1934 domain-containing protein [Oscillospiraceae bacterium]